MNEVGTRDRLMEVAIDLFARKGFSGTSIRDIAGEMQMSVSNIYHYFRNKEGVLTAVLEHATDRLLSDLRTAVQSEGDARARFERLLRAHLEMIVDRPQEARVYVLEVESLSAEAGEVSRRAQREVLDIYLKALGALQADGYLGGRNLTVTAFNVFGVLNWFLRWYRGAGALSTREVLQEVTGFVLGGLTLRPA